MDRNRHKIVEFSKEAAEKFDCLLIDVELRGDSRNKIIEVFIDNEKGITAEVCGDVSKEINVLLEQENIFDGKYRLDVSSPGIDRPLIYLKQFPKNIGRQFKVIYKSDDNKESFEGKLERINGEFLEFSVKKELRTIPFESIITAKVKISFWLLEAQ